MSTKLVILSCHLLSSKRRDAPYHNVIQVRNTQNNRYKEWIRSHGFINWPSNSSKSTTLDNFLWSYLNDHVYKERSQNLRDLSERIRNSIISLNEYPEYICNDLFNLDNKYRKSFEKNAGHIQHLYINFNKYKYQYIIYF